MNIQTMASSVHIMRLGMWLSQHTPEAFGHRLLWWASGALCQVRPMAYDVVQSNLKQVLGPSADRETLERTVRQVFYTSLRSSFHLFRALRLPLEELFASVELTEASQAVARSMWQSEGGTVLVFPHVDGYDLGGLMAPAHIPELQIITLPDPPPGFRLTNEIRKFTGTTVTPLSSAALRQAIRLLRRGGVVSLAGDRPVSDLDKQVPFFDCPARVPSAHVRLALRTNAIVVIYYCTYSSETKTYTVHFEPPLQMVRTGNREEEVRLNMRRVLDALEAIISARPGHWQMYMPVWPEFSV